MRAYANRVEALPMVEDLLLDYAERLAHHRPGRRALHIHMSRLQRVHRRLRHVGIAAAAFDTLAKRSQGQVFRLTNHDVVIVVKGVGVAELDDIVLRLRYMFDDDPLVHEPDDATSEQRFCDWYDLETAYGPFLAAAQALHQAAREQRLKDAERKPPPSTGEARRPKLDPLDPLKLSKVEQVIAPVNIRPMLRRQPICSAPDGGAMKVVCNELFVSIDALGHVVAPNIDLRADPWLFQHLIARLDRRVMAVLPELEAAIALPTSLNLSLDALASPGFLAFDDRLRARTGKGMVAEINWLDALRDMANFSYVRDLLRLRKWGVAIDGLTATNYAMIDCGAFDPDYIKLAWNADLADLTPSRGRGQFLDAVARTAPRKLVLMHCGEQAAITFGRSLGIGLYQGRYVDAALKQRAAA